MKITYGQLFKHQGVFALQDSGALPKVLKIKLRPIFESLQKSASWFNEEQQGAAAEERLALLTTEFDVAGECLGDLDEILMSLSDEADKQVSLSQWLDAKALGIVS